MDTSCRMNGVRLTQWCSMVTSVSSALIPRVPSPSRIKRIIANRSDDRSVERQDGSLATCGIRILFHLSLRCVWWDKGWRCPYGVNTYAIFLENPRFLQSNSICFFGNLKFRRYHSVCFFSRKLLIFNCHFVEKEQNY